LKKINDLLKIKNLVYEGGSILINMNLEGRNNNNIKREIET